MKYKLKVIDLKNKLPTQHISIDHFPFSIGRGSDNDLVLNHSLISKNHAELIKTEDSCLMVKDLGSTNGTWKKERKINSEKISDKDSFEIGGFSFVFFFEKDSKEDLNVMLERAKPTLNVYNKEKIRVKVKNPDFESSYQILDFLWTRPVENYSLKLFAYHFIICFISSFIYLLFFNSTTSYVKIFFGSIIASLILIIIAFFINILVSSFARIISGSFRFISLLNYSINMLLLASWIDIIKNIISFNLYESDLKIKVAAFFIFCFWLPALYLFFSICFSHIHKIKIFALGFILPFLYSSIFILSSNSPSKNPVLGFDRFFPLKQNILVSEYPIENLEQKLIKSISDTQNLKKKEIQNKRNLENKKNRNYF